MNTESTTAQLGNGSLERPKGTVFGNSDELPPKQAKFTQGEFLRILGELEFTLVEEQDIPLADERLVRHYPRMTSEQFNIANKHRLSLIKKAREAKSAAVLEVSA